MKADCFEGQDMRIVIANPPFGAAGGKDAADGVGSAVRKNIRKLKNTRVRRNWSIAVFRGGYQLPAICSSCLCSMPFIK